MRMKPILFNTEMVRAILAGSKTQTRRVIKPQPKVPQSENDIEAGEVVFWHGKVCRMKEPRARNAKAAGNLIAEVIEPYSPGDILWVREAWKQYTTGTAGPGLIDGYLYKADEPQDTSGMMVEGCWHPSIHMPQNAARLFLQVTDIYVDRLQSISEDDVCAEGAEKIITKCEHMDYNVTPPEPCFNVNPCKKCVINYSYPELFGDIIWNPTIKKADLSKYGWDANPLVWVIKFQKVDPETKIQSKWEEWWPGDCSLIMTGEEMLWKCSNCTAKHTQKSKYCPTCGAKMNE